MNKHNQFKKFKTVKQSFTRNRNTGKNNKKKKHDDDYDH